MPDLSSTAKGDMFEDEVFEFFKSYVLSGEYSFVPDKCKFYQQKGYYSDKREKNIKVDLSIEVHAQNEENLAFLLIGECKNYKHPVGVEDIEEFDSKLRQISERNVKGIVFTKVGFREGAFKVAKNTGIALARILPEDQIEWVLERTPKAINVKNRETEAENEVIKALINKDYIGQSEAVFGTYGEIFSSSFSRILDALIPKEYRTSSGAKKKQKVRGNPKKSIPFLGQEDIEKRASRVLEYFKLGMSNDKQVMLTPVCEYLEKNNEISFIFDENLGVSSEGSDVLGKLSLSQNQIYVSSQLEENSPRWRFTLAHEIAHFLLHRNLYEDLKKIDHFETEDTLSWDSSNRSPTYRLEWQANSLASALLLPRSSIIPTVIEMARELGVSKFSHGVIYLDDQKTNIQTYQNILQGLKIKFNISYQAINYRLIQLRILNNQSRLKKIRDIARNLPILKRG